MAKKLTKTEKQITLQILKKTLKDLEALHPQTTRGVCALIREVVGELACDASRAKEDLIYSQGNYLKHWIRRMLGSGNMYLVEWLAQRDYTDWDKIPSNYEACLKLKNTRIAWVKWMICKIKEA